MAGAKWCIMLIFAGPLGDRCIIFKYKKKKKSQGMCIFIAHSWHVETVVLLSQLKQKPEDSRQPQCPEDKESAIVEALKHFKMIQQK